VSHEERVTRIIAAELLVCARDVEKLAEQYGAPELLRWARRITDDAIGYVGLVEGRNK
jgi:hypothetical protein